MSSTIVLITGANQGLGLEAVRAVVQASADKYHVLLSARSLSKAEDAASKIKESIPDAHIEPVQLDVDDDQSISALVSHIETAHGHLDVLVNNAGIGKDAEWHKGLITPRQAINDTLTTNTISAAVVTESMLPLLSKSNKARILFISSELGTFASAADPDNGFYSLRGDSYRMSKAALNMYTLELSKRLRKEGLSTVVLGVCPGFNVTNLGGTSEGKKDMGGSEPHVGGQVIADAIMGNRDDCSGGLIWRQGKRSW